MRYYIIYILKVNDEIESTMENINNFIKKKAEIEKIVKEGIKKLNYPIKGHEKAYYTKTFFTYKDDVIIAELENFVKKNDNVLAASVWRIEGEEL